MDLSIEELEGRCDEIIVKAKDWCMLHGMSVRPKDGSTDYLEFAPFTLLPSPFPRSEYRKIFELQYVLNELLHRLSQDSDFLRESLKEVIKNDEFTRRLYEIYERAKSAQTVSLVVFRSDYMLDGNHDVCKQVEVNTASVGAAWMGTACVNFHRYILKELEVEYSNDNLLASESIDGVCKALADAWKIYDKPRSVVLFVVGERPQNIGDQRYHEYGLRELDSRIRVIRRTLSRVFKFGKLEGADRRLIVDDYEVALVYFRTGIGPDDYPTEDEWNARLMMEQSKAIKCPSMPYVLAGTKKIQQLLAQPGCLERFISAEDSDRLRQVFTGLYSLDLNEAGDAALEMAIANPENFVLKPQREGGSNNLFGEDVKRKLESIRGDEERNNWTLMDRIAAKVHRNYLVRPNNSDSDRPVDVTSEIGIFGTLLVDGGRILSSKVAGHMIRTKFAYADECGLSSGFGATDTPYLV